MKYFKFLLQFKGLEVKVLMENGICHIIATNQFYPMMAINPGIMIANIKEVHDDFIVLEMSNSGFMTFPLSMVVMAGIPNLG